MTFPIKQTNRIRAAINLAKYARCDWLSGHCDRSMYLHHLRVAHHLCFSSRFLVIS